MSCHNCDYTFMSQVPLTGDVTCGKCHKQYPVPKQTLLNGLGLNTDGQHVFEVTTLMRCPHCDQTVDYVFLTCDNTLISILDILTSTWFLGPVIVTTEKAPS